MNNKQYDECLLSILTYCESLNKTDYYPIKNDSAFGMTRSELLAMVDSLNRNHYTKAIIVRAGISFTPLTLEGREKLEELREKLKGQSVLVRVWRFILRNWHYFLLLFKR